MSLANMIDLDCLDGIDIITDPSIIRSSTEPDQQNSQAKLVFSTPMSNEGANLLTCMLITANVGTIFEEVSDRYRDCARFQCDSSIWGRDSGYIVAIENFL